MHWKNLINKWLSLSFFLKHLALPYWAHNPKWPKCIVLASIQKKIAIYLWLKFKFISRYLYCITYTAIVRAWWVVEVLIFWVLSHLTCQHLFTKLFFLSVEFGSLENSFALLSISQQGNDMHIKVSVKQEDVDVFYFTVNALYVALHMSLAGIKKGWFLCMSTTRGQHHLFYPSRALQRLLRRITKFIC